MNNQNIITCHNCPKKKETNHWSSDSWDRMCDWVCAAVKDEDDKPKKIAGCVEWHDECLIKVPDWCPLKVTQIVIPSPPEPKLPNHYTINDLMEAFKAGYDSKTGQIGYMYDANSPYIEYEQIETFEEWFYKYTR